MGCDVPVFGKDPEKTFCLNRDFQVTLMVATIPDPSKTRLGLSADRAIASIQKGAQDADWEFDSQWLEWKFATDGDPGEKRWLPKDANKAEPGILIFRRTAAKGAIQFPREARFVFIVGETPTAGVNATELAKFFSYRKDIFQDTKRFDIAGPTFSGSLPSLAYALSSHRGEVKRVYSGTVTDGAYADVFRGDAPEVTFRSAAQDSATTIRELLEVGRRLGVGEKDIAILAEDETAFGGSFARGKDKLIAIPFPREISSLRNASQVTGAEASNVVQPISGGVPFSLHDADGGEDSVPLFGHSQTALSQYSTVTRIVSLIRGRFKLVEVAATNVLDALFLTTVLHEGAPDTRILVANVDLLFVRAAREQSLSGILALPNYPPHLTDPSVPNINNEVLVFPDGDSAALYRAVRGLLKSNAEDLEPSGGAWLAEFTAAGSWPIGKFGQALKAGEVSFRLSRQWEISTAIAVAFAFWLCGTFWYARRSDRTHFEIFRTPLPAGSDSETWTHGALALFTIARSLAVISALSVPVLALRLTDGWPLWVAAGIAPLAAAVAIVVRYDVPVCVAPVVICLFGAIPAMMWVPLFHASGSERSLMAVRSLQIASGCSGTVPVVPIILGLILAALLHMNRFSMIIYRDTDVPRGGLEEDAQKNLNVFTGRVNAILRHPGMMPMNEKQTSTVFAIVIVLGVLTHPLQHLSSVEGRAFTWLLFGLALSLLLAIVWSTIGVVAIWGNLRSFLGELNRQPLGGAFRRLPRQFSGSAIWAGMPMSRTFVTFFGSAECIAEFCTAFGRLTTKDRVVYGHSCAWKVRLNASARQIRGWEQDGKLTDRGELIRQLRECAEFLQAEFLVPEWNLGRTDPDPGTAAVGKPEKLSDEEQAYRLAAKFVALRYAAWLRYVVRHVRNLLFVIFGGYVLLSMALPSLDFQSPQAIRWFPTLLFLAIATPLLYCMAQMDRDAVLSRMSDTTVGELNRDFYVKAASYIGLPLVGVLSSQFPAFSRFIFSWMQPTLDVLK